MSKRFITVAEELISVMPCNPINAPLVPSVKVTNESTKLYDQQ